MSISVYRDRVLRAARTAMRTGGASLGIALQAASETNRLRLERAWRAEVERAGRGQGPVVVGPWISEVGFEILYWIPMLRRIVQRAGLDPERATVITRGGAHCWYRDIARHSVEIFDLVEPDRLRELNEQRVAETGGQKHMAVTALDRELIHQAAPLLPPDAELVHPLLMYNTLRYYWAWRSPPKRVLGQLEFRRLPDPGLTQIVQQLPEEYVAFKAYHSSCFPPTPSNRAFVGQLVRRLAERTNVVLLSTGLRFDDHAEVTLDAGGGEVIDVRAWMKPQDNLAVQTQIIKGASCLFSSYGGFSYLGPFVGVPSVCFWSVANFNATHLELMRRAVDQLRAPRFVALDVADVDLLDRVLATPVEVGA